MASNFTVCILFRTGELYPFIPQVFVSSHYINYKEGEKLKVTSCFLEHTLHLQPSNPSQKLVQVSVIYKECWCRARLSNGLQRLAVKSGQTCWNNRIFLRNLPDKTYLLLLTF